MQKESVKFTNFKKNDGICRRFFHSIRMETKLSEGMAEIILS